jgi:hypothetical protein
MRVKFALSGALLLLLGSYAIAQEITATILGTVTDSSGAVVSGATIIVVNTDQAIVVRRLAASNNGEYVGSTSSYRTLRRLSRGTWVQNQSGNWNRIECE